MLCGEPNRKEKQFMNANTTVLVLLIIIVAMIASWNLTLRCNGVFTERYGKSVISYIWAGVCGFAGMATISSFGIEDDSRFIVLAVTAVLTVISMRKCKKRAAEMGADESMSKKAMWIQFIAPLGIVGIFLALTIGSSSNKKKK